MYKYRIYGLNVLSDIELKCYAAEFDVEDINIIVTFEYDRAYALKSSFDQANVNEFTLPDEMGVIYVCNTDQLIVYCRSALKWDQVKICLLGFSFSFILVKRHIFTFHGNSIIHKNKGLMFLGRSGSGKSSITAGYIKLGDQFLSDDISRVSVSDSNAVVYPSYPSFKLCLSTAQQFNIDISDATEVFYEKNKYQISCESLYHSDPVPLHAIICIQPSDRINIALMQERPQLIIRNLFENTYNNTIASLPEYYRDLNQTLMLLLGKVPFFTLHRPKDTFTVSEQIEIIDRELFGSI